MSHPKTSKHAGYRLFDGASFGELEYTTWDFDGTESDVHNFATANLCDVDVDVESVKDIGDGSFDVLLSDGNEFRVYTESNN